MACEIHFEEHSSTRAESRVYGGTLGNDAINRDVQSIRYHHTNARGPQPAATQVQVEFSTSDAGKRAETLLKEAGIPCVLKENGSSYLITVPVKIVEEENAAVAKVTRALEDGKMLTS